jgi:hypothetical protein
VPSASTPGFACLAAPLASNSLELCMSWARLHQSRPVQFLQGTAVACAGCGVVYLFCDALSDVITLRECQKLVLPLALKHEQLTEALEPPLEVGSVLFSSMRASPTGSMVQCQFTMEGKARSSQVTATVRRQAHGTPLLYNILGPGKWELTNCHVLVGVLHQFLTCSCKLGS